MGLVFGASLASGDQPRTTAASTNLIEIRSVTVNGKVMSWRVGRPLALGFSPEIVSIGFGPATNSNWTPVRLHYRMEGYDAAWRRGLSEMILTLRFYNDARDLIDQKVFKAMGDSTGWNGSLKTSTLTHRRETITVPPRASRCMAVISSAGPPAAVGIYVVENLSVSRVSSTNGRPEILLRPLLENDPTADKGEQRPRDWVRDGTRPSMARSVELGQDPTIGALAILDDDPIGHAEWHNLMEASPRVAPGDLLVMEWNELFSIGVADTRSASYYRLPPGNYRFCVQEETALGVPTEVETSLAIRVPAPFWGRSWFWVTVAGVLAVASAAGARYRASYKLRREVQRLKQQRALEQERLRIARDIHDDLGARVTQISMLSAMAPDHASFPENARADFERISKMSRELISALYETVWAVNPKNDNLNALGNYLRQMSSQLCESAQLSCRLYIPALPREVPVSSQTRHNLTMAAKEAIHNVMKHTEATEVTVRIAFTENRLTVCIQDNGRGFQTAGPAAGNGLSNMKRRLEDLGASCMIESQIGRGTSVTLSLGLEATKPCASL
jgi:signal transduction histidine kinase